MLVFVFNFDLFKVSAAILEKGLFISAWSNILCAAVWSSILYAYYLGRLVGLGQ